MTVSRIFPKLVNFIFFRFTAHSYEKYPMQIIPTDSTIPLVTPPKSV